MNKIIKKPFARMQEIAVETLRSMCNFKHIMLIFFISVFLFSLSCRSRNKEDVNPQKTILGRWELIGHGGFYTQSKIIAVEPNGSYIEFLLDESVQRYDSKKDEFQVLALSYLIDENFIIYNPEKPYEQGWYVYKYKLTNEKLEMTHHNGCVEELYSGQILIYQRKK